MLISGLMTLAMIIINNASHDKTKEIYTERMQEMAINLKKDYLKDTVNNMILELDRIKETKTNLYQFNVKKRHLRFLDEKDLSDQDFADFYRTRFEEENEEGLWTAVLYDEDTKDILYENLVAEMEEGDIIKELEASLLAFETVKHGNLVGIFGVSEEYRDQVVKNEIKGVIHNQEFSNDSYIWVNEVLDYEGGENYAIRRIHPNLIDNEGSFLSTSTQDAEGNFPFLIELEGVRETGELFFNYHFKKLNSDIVSEKITYAKLYEPYDWIIAMGVHLDDIKENVAYVNARSDESVSDNIFVFITYSVAVIFLGFFVLFLINEKYFKKSMEKLENEVNLDLLTGASSRRWGESILTLFFQKYQVSGNAPVLMMYDIDNFKKINDQYGHEIGDQVLIAVTNKVQSALGEEDAVIRWGGDEFICLLHQNTEEGIRSVVEKIQKKIDEISIETESGSIGTSVSIGTTRFIYEDNAYTDTVKRADQAMYQSKRQGKSKWTCLKK